MDKKQNLIDNCLYNEMRDFAINTLQGKKAKSRSVSNYFKKYALNLSFPYSKIFGCKELGVRLDSFEGKNLAVASLSQMEKPAGSSYYFDLAFVVRPVVDLRAPILHGDAQDPLAGMKGMFSMDIYNHYYAELDVDEFLGKNVSKIKQALEIVKPYQKTVDQGRGKYTAYLDPYKSNYRVELVQPPATDVGGLKKFYKVELEAFKLYYEAYLASLANLKPEKDFVQDNKAKYDEFFGAIVAKDFAANTGKKIYKDDFQKYFHDGFWRSDDYGIKI